ncbi:MAG: Holliday junction resolvase RuvX [Chitinophagales bacterium]|nr:Holliday junction resolvase RuvX [Chitinophagales bacterium]
MARILAIDFGLRRTGLAVTDPLQIIASPFQAVESRNLMSFLETYFMKEEVELIVVGDPKNLDGTANPLSQQVHKLVRELEKKFPEKKVVMVDERFTSKMAQQSIMQSGLKKKDRRQKSLTDIVSAALILQHYLDLRK